MPKHLMTKLNEQLASGKRATVNVVIFAGGKFRENVGKTFHVGVIFTILLIFPS